MNARSYSGTQTHSDHRLVITRMQIAPYNLFKTQTKKYTKPINTDKLQIPEVRRDYILSIKEKFEQIQIEDHTNIQQKWDRAVNTIVKTAERVLGRKISVNRNNHRVYDREIKHMSKKQKRLRISISSSNEIESICKMRNKRNRILKTIKKKVLANKEKEIDEAVKEIDVLQDEAKMFKAVKMLNRKRFETPFVHDNEGKQVIDPKEIYETIREHFQTHFYDKNMKSVSPFIGQPKSLINRITTEEVTNAIKKLNNNRAAGPDGISAELVKYAPVEVHQFISETLNYVLENHQELDIGKGNLIALQKPGKIKGPVKNLRPIILLLIIRKILSNITCKRIKVAYEAYISQSQSAYRENRSTADVVWTHRWIAAKAQNEKISIYITGIDMSSAFDTIIREELVKILEQILHEDEMRMCRLLLSQTTLDVKINDVETEKFESNIGSPQGDGISGIFFNIYLEESLRRTRFEAKGKDPTIEHSYAIKKKKNNLPEEEIYADDTDFTFLDKEERDNTLKAAKKIFPTRNLKINEDKTEHTEIKRGDRNTESWRYAKKVGSLIGDTEDIMRRKQLAIASMNNLFKIWIRQDHISEIRRLKLYQTLVKPVLTYNCGTWGLTKKDEEQLDSFHRRQLRIIIRKKYPHIISNKNLYKRCKESPLSTFILKSRWKLFGHILRLNKECPANKAMIFYFENINAKRFSGNPRITIVKTLNNDIKRTKEKEPSFPIRKLTTSEDLDYIRQLANDKIGWKSIVRIIHNVAEDEKPY